MRAQLKRELLRALLEGQAYMPEILARLRERGFVRASSVGSEMRALERKGLVASVPREEVSARIGRPRIYYALTERGRREALEGWR
jgi:DNA-binding PadR family transcriptional regulator